MDPSPITEPLGKELNVASANDSSLNPDVDVSVTAVPSKNSDNIPTIIIEPSSNDNDLTVTPAFPNFPTDEEVVIEPESIILLQPANEISEQEIAPSSLPTTTSRPSQQTSQLLDELKYLLKPTNSLANPDITIQASQEANATIKRRTTQLDEDVLNNTNRLLIEELTPTEAKSLGSVDRRSFAARSQRLSNTTLFSDRSRSSVMRPSVATRSHSQLSPTILIAYPEHRTFLDHLSGVVWAFLAAYSFSIILFLTKTCGIDLIFGFFLQMIVQTIAFGIYAFYKGYNLLGPSENRIAMICRALLIGTGTLTSFLAYYYITLPELSAIRQSQVILTIIFSIFFLRERVTITRISAFILTIIAVTILIRPTKLGLSTSTVVNSTDYKISWIPYSSTWNHIIGISFVLCTAITHSIASTLNKIYFSTQHLHNTVLCFWSALLALIISIILVYLTHFTLENALLFPHDWRLYVGIGLALASIFVFIANQKAIKREHSSIVTVIYSTDILLALILQNLLTHIKSDAVIILGCLLVLASILIVCIEVLLMEKNTNTLAIDVANTTGQDDNNNLQNRSSIKTAQKRFPV